jgi:putative transposase
MSKKIRPGSRVSNRLPHWDYSSNAPYFITICTQNRKNFFGEISDGKMHLSDIGKIAENEWIKTPNIRPEMQLGLGEFVVMPNHFHAMLIIGNGRVDARHGGDAMRCVPSFQNKFGPQSNNLASIIRGFKSAVTTQVKKLYSCRDALPSRDAMPCVRSFKWQSGFHDHIIRDAESFARIEKYIMNNPANWRGDKNFS